jgi:DNA-binding IclR family transcriptional regulator
LAELRVLRHSIGLCLEFIEITRRTVSDDLTEALLFAAALNANVSHLDVTAESSRHWAMFNQDFVVGQRRAIRIARLSDSLGIPRQTARNKVEALLKAGWAERLDSGVIIRSQPFLTEAGLVSLGQYLEASERFFSRGADDGLCGLVPGDALVNPPVRAGWLIMRLMTNHVLHTLYALRLALQSGSPTADFVLLNLIQAAWSDSDEDYRQGLGASVLAGRLRLPRETTRRHVVQLEAIGLVRREADGFSVTPELAASTQVLSAAAGLKAGLRRIVRRAREAGALPEWEGAPGPGI